MVANALKNSLSLGPELPLEVKFADIAVELSVISVFVLQSIYTTLPVIVIYAHDTVHLPWQIMDV
jgi:hypothetical protein